MKLKTLALAITASFALSGCFVDDIIDDIKNDIDDGIENVENELNEFLTSDDLNRQAVVRPSAHEIYTYTESTGIVYSNTTTQKAANFSYSILENILSIAYDDGTTTIFTLTQDLDNLYTATETNADGSTTVTKAYTALPLVLADLNGKTIAFTDDGDGCKSTVKFSADTDTAEYAEMCGTTTTTSHIDLSTEASLDNVINLTTPDENGELTTNNMMLYKGSLSDAGSLAFIFKDALGNPQEVSIDEFTISQCHLPETLHEMANPDDNHCMIGSVEDMGM